jgi:hypothetical protein
LPASFFLWLGGFLALYGVLTHTMKMWFARHYGID